MDAWFEDTAMGRYVAKLEQDFFGRYLDSYRFSGMCAVQVGGRWLMPSEDVVCVPRDMSMSAENMALADVSADMLLFPHTLEGGVPSQILSEAHRILKPSGRLMLTGFNPYSLWGFGHWFDGKRLPEKRFCLPLPGLKRQLADVGFDIEFGKFMVYLPPVSSLGQIRFWQFMEKAGDRWWPQCAAVYGLVLVKRAAGVTPLPAWDGYLGGKALAAGAARVAD
ncbi:class I SAM-dependent methyltransferase [Neisseria uirgultaei]|uniref:class I SAM-dependent methyltransferase n=1 Tax=Neisseria uirgultaei TaxID=2830646 RepID=UPI002657F8E6|nr:methyltransferase domain-containing protein [Neisseria uirgultaei]